MRLVIPLLTVAAAVLGGWSCSDKNAPSDNPQALTSSAQATPGKSSVAAAASGGARTRNTASSAGPTIPKGAEWTILCAAVGGPDHVDRGRRLKETLLKTTNLKDWYLVHNEGQTQVYYGYYRSINDAKDKKESERAQRDRKQIDALRDSMGNRPFSRAIFVALDAPDPSGTPEWNLVNADGYWSLQIAAYRDHPDRKKAAVEAVREARKQGIEAYYYHGQTTSSVCVGAWPREAVTEQVETGGGGGGADDSVFIFPSNMVPPDQKLPSKGVKVGPDGERATPVTARIIVQDPTMAAAMKQYPNHAINGEIMVTRRKDPMTGRIQEVADDSFLIAIPRAAPSALGLDGALTGDSPQQPDAAGEPAAAPAPPSPSRPGVGRLKSIGS